MNKRVILILSCLLFSIGYVMAQTTVSGSVADDLDEPLVSVSVIVKGTTTGVTTDIDGNFTITLPADNNTLMFRLIGMKSVERKATNGMKVVMEEDSELLDEVVVTAMGITREKKAQGYASQGVSADNLTKGGNTSLSGALQGKVSGVTITPSSGMPGASSQITIRGSRSFEGNNTPLYVIDGMPVSSTSDVSTGNSVTGVDFANRAVDIDPSDIASIDILKGQAASALYGIRASNGVIIITTKSGKGLKKGKPQITLNSSVSFEKPTRFPNYQTKYAQGVYSKEQGRFIYDPQSSLSWGPLISELPNDPKYGGNTVNTNTDRDGMQNGKYYVPQRASAGLDPWVTPQSYDNVRDFFETGTTFNNSVNVAQALEKSSYSVSLGITSQDGIVPSTGMDRYTGKVSAETKLTDQFTTGFTGTYVNTLIQKAPSANTGLLATLYAAPASYDLKGIPSHVEGNPYQQVHFRAGSFENPYWGSQHNEFTEKTSRFYGNVYTNFSTKLHSTDKKLDVKYQLGIDSYTTNYLDKYAYGSNYYEEGSAEEYSWDNTSVNSLLTTTFNWTINEDWKFTALAGNEIIHDSRKYLYAEGINFGFQGWDHIKNATTYKALSRDRSKRIVGFFGDITASFKNMLYMEITGRNDFVSHMPRGARSFFYPSVNASFILTELEALKDLKVLDFAKVRASYAEVGQAGDYRENYYISPEYGGGFYSGDPIKYPMGGVAGFAPYTTVYDSQLKPQNTRSYEVGVDMTFLNSLFDISYTYARQNVTDQIFSVPLAGSTGFRNILTNGGKVHTNSHELVLNVNPVRTNLVDWSVGLNWTKIDNYVDELAPGVESIFLGGFTTPQVRAGIGYKFPVIYGSSYKRDSQGRILVDEKGNPMVGSDTVIGKVSPDFLLGFNTSLRIGKVFISAVFDWKAGGQMYHGTNSLLNLYGVGLETENRENPVVFDGWKANGTKNDIEIAHKDQSSHYSAINNIDESAIYDNSFFKLREVSVSYKVYKSSLIEVGLNAFARNILLWTELPNFDPESSQGNTNMAGAFERFSMPQASSYGMGVNVKF